jgi:hypothetical protein
MPPLSDPNFPRKNEAAAAALAERGVRVGAVRLATTVHGIGDPLYMAILARLARQKGVSAYIGDGANRWPAVHVSDAGRLYRLALEAGAPARAYHASAEQGIAFRAIAEAIGRALDLPVSRAHASISAGSPISSRPTRPRRAPARATLPAGSLPGQPCSPTSLTRPISPDERCPLSCACRHIGVGTEAHRCLCAWLQVESSSSLGIADPPCEVMAATEVIWAAIIRVSICDRVTPARIHASRVGGALDALERSDYFESIPRAELLQCVARRVVDRRILHLSKMWQEAAVEETDRRGIRSAQEQTATTNEAFHKVRRSRHCCPHCT